MQIFILAVPSTGQKKWIKKWFFAKKWFFLETQQTNQTFFHNGYFLGPFNNKISNVNPSSENFGLFPLEQENIKFHSLQQFFFLCNKNISNFTCCSISFEIFITTKRKFKISPLQHNFLDFSLRNGNPIVSHCRGKSLFLLQRVKF